jgi:hypothetical protein
MLTKSLSSHLNVASFFIFCFPLLSSAQTYKCSTQKLLTTLRILSEMPQAQALVKPDFISERIEPSVRYVENKTLIFHSHVLILHGQLNEARLTEVRLRLWDLQRRLLVNNQSHLLNIQIDDRKKKKKMFEEGREAGCICLGFPDF